MEKSNLLECRNICKSFGENHVLKGINIKLFSGEVSAIIGGNGAGKSTFKNCNLLDISTFLALLFRDCSVS